MPKKVSFTDRLIDFLKTASADEINSMIATANIIRDVRFQPVAVPTEAKPKKTWSRKKKVNSNATPEPAQEQVPF